MTTFRTSTRPWTVLTALSVLQLLIALDVTVVNVALPSIGADLGAGAGDLTWVVTGYMVAGGGLLMLGGRIADLLGRRRMYLLGAAVFGLASLLAGVAPTLPVLVVARLLQGAGEALAAPAAMSLIALTFPEPARRARALGVWGAIASSGLVLGVLASGVLTQLAGWRWIFLVNPPLVLVALVAAWILLDRDHPAARPRLDLPGAALLTIAPLTLVFGVVRAGHAGWTVPGVLGPIAAALVAAVAFVIVERRTREPLVPPRVLAHHIRLVANGATVLLSAALSTTFLLCTLYLQDDLGYGPLAAGLAFLPLCAALLVAVSFVARLVGALGVRGTAVLGLLLAAAGAAWLARLPATGGLWVDVVPGMVAVAAGMGIGLVALQNAALHDVTDDDAGVASGVQRCADQLGGAVGLAVLVGAVFPVFGYTGAFAVGLVGVLVAAVGVTAASPRTPTPAPSA